MSKKISPDWEAIESAYRAGSLSIRAIASAQGTSESTIRSRAKRNGWQRDLTEKVKTATKAKLSRKASRTSSAQEDAQIIDEASDEATEVVLAHRTHLSEWRGIASRLSVALSNMDITEDNHDKIARSLNSGVDALLKVIKGERQAYNLDDDDDLEETGKSLADLLAEVAPGEQE